MRAVEREREKPDMVSWPTCAIKVHPKKSRTHEEVTASHRKQRKIHENMSGDQVREMLVVQVDEESGEQVNLELWNFVNSE